MTYSVKDYFDAAALEYRRRSSNGLWAWQRQRERHTVFELLGQLDRQDVLDLGCGAGFYSVSALKKGARRVIGVDFSRQMIAQLPENVTGIVADATELELDETVSRIVCTGVLEFVENPTQVLLNARHIATKDCTLVCLVPPASIGGFVYRLFHLSHGFRITLFSKRNFQLMASNSGWSVEQMLSVFPYSMVYKLKPIS